MPADRHHKTFVNDRRSLWTNFSRSRYAVRLQDGRTLTVTRLGQGVITSVREDGSAEYELLDGNALEVLLHKVNTPSRTIDGLLCLPPLPGPHDGEW